MGAHPLSGGDGTIRQPAIAPQVYDSPFERSVPVEATGTSQLRWKPLEGRGEERAVQSEEASGTARIAAVAAPGLDGSRWGRAASFRRQPSEESGSHRFQLASRISAQIRQPGSDGATIENLPRLEPPPGWQAVGQRLTSHWLECASLLRRGAHLSALDEAEQAVVYLTRILDASQNQHRAEPAWLNAQVALREAEEFDGGPQLAEDPEFLARLVASHATPILKRADLTAMSPLVAAQYYRRYALAQLLQAAHGHPWASELFVAIGQCYQARAVTEGEQGGPLWYRALVFYQAAHQISPDNALAANQLAYTLLQLDRPREAREVLLPSVQQIATRENLQNLIEASRRTGDAATAGWATARLAQLGRPPAGLPLPQVMEVPPDVFARLSPYEAIPQASGPRTASTPTERR